MPADTGNFGETIRAELEDDYRVFYVTARGYAADHYFGWLPKALNSHREIFALLAHEGSRPKYMKERLRSERPDLEAFTEFLNDMGMTYGAIGDCYSYRGTHFNALRRNSQYAGVPVVNLLRHPVVWLEFYIRWRSGNMRMRSGASDPLAHEWRVTQHGLFASLGLRAYDNTEIDVWAAYQGMLQINGVLGDLQAVKTQVAIENVIAEPALFEKLVEVLTKGRVVYEKEDLDRAYAMVPTLFRGEQPVDTDPRSLLGQWPGWKVDAFRKLVSEESARAYREFGYDLFDLDAPGLLRSASVPRAPETRPIFVASVMKAGTWLMRGVMRELTGLEPYEPKISPGGANYEDENLITFPDGCFFSWHSVITQHAEAVLRATGARNIFVVRNIYDLILSMYNHLQFDVDAGIGGSVGGGGHFDGLTDELAISMVINGFMNEKTTWHGLGPHLKQMESLFRAASTGLGIIVAYEGLVAQKSAVVRQIAGHLEIGVSDADLERIEAATTVEKMRAAAVSEGNEGHFRTESQRQPRSMIVDQHIQMVNAVMARDAPELHGLIEGSGLHWLEKPIARA